MAGCSSVAVVHRRATGRLSARPVDIADQGSCQENSWLRGLLGVPRRRISTPVYVSWDRMMHGQLFWDPVRVTIIVKQEEERNENPSLLWKFYDAFAVVANFPLIAS